MSGKSPRTMKEAFIAEMIGDLDTLLTRIEKAPSALDQAEKNTLKLIEALEGASDKYRMTVTAFTEQAKTELKEYLDRKTLATVDAQRTAIQTAAREAFKIETTGIAETIAHAIQESKQSTASRRIELAAATIAASCITALVTAALLMFLKR